jgi:hypothetical protein
MGEVFADDAELGVPSVDVISCELRVLAQILGLTHAISAGAVRRIEPRNSDAVAYVERANIGAGCVD